MPSNKAAWLPAEKATYLEVKSAPYTSPGPNEITIVNHAVAINPVDWAIQAMGSDLFDFIKYPAILGSDVAGEVVEVGSGVTRFKAGDRVVGLAVGLKGDGAADFSSEGAFQQYVVLQTNIASTIPDTLSYENAAVLPLGISTAASGLFQKDYLALQYPTIPSKPTGKTLLVWGGSTSVGSNGVQLAVAAGYEVISTSSPKNFEYVKRLGASQVFDYNSKTIVDDLIQAFKGKTIAGALAIGNIATVTRARVAEMCLEVVDKSEGDKFVAMAMPVPKDLPQGVGAKFIFGSDLMNNDVGSAVYEHFLPRALAEGSYICAPEPLIVGTGLEHIQEAFEIQKKGMSAKKVVVSL